MKEYFIITASFAAPFFSDMDEHWIKAKSPKDALDKIKKSYKHPFGLYSACCYKDANSWHKDEKPLAKFLSRQAKKDWKK